MSDYEGLYHTKPDSDLLELAGREDIGSDEWVQSAILIFTIWEAEAQTQQDKAQSLIERMADTTSDAGSWGAELEKLGK